MFIREVNENFQQKVKDLLKKNKIRIRDFQNFGWFRWDYPYSYLGLKKYKNVYDYPIGKIKGYIGED